MSGPYINPYTDFGFKKLFGEEGNKELLIDFLNEVIPDRKISDLTFQPTEKLPRNEQERKAIYDIYCTGTNGEIFIVKLQKAKIDFFRDRMVYYATFPIQEQARKGVWNYKLAPVYCVAIIDFLFSDTKHHDYISNIKLMNQYCEIFYDKLAFILVEMPRFQKNEAELKTHFDKWLYFLKHLADLNEIPAILNEPIFTKAFEAAAIAKMDQTEFAQYQTSLKVYWDLNAAVNTAYDEGKIEGKIETARKMKLRKMANADITDLTGLSAEEIERL